MSIKVIGTGVGRTGTHSLKLALDQLGLGKCYHMSELFQHPEGLIAFQKAEKGEEVDWDNLFKDYHSAVDYPVARYYKQLLNKYPDAKFIHTIRDPESWYQSASQTIIWASKPSFGRIVQLLIKLPFSPQLRKQFPILKFNGRLIELEFGKDFKNKDAVIAHFNQHNEEVLQTIPKEKLLIFNPKDGWEPLCRFLDLPVPQMPFPQSNKRDEFIYRIKHIGNKVEI